MRMGGLLAVWLVDRPVGWSTDSLTYSIAPTRLQTSHSRVHDTVEYHQQNMEKSVCVFPMTAPAHPHLLYCVMCVYVCVASSNFDVS